MAALNCSSVKPRIRLLARPKVSGAPPTNRIASRMRSSGGGTLSAGSSMSRPRVRQEEDAGDKGAGPKHQEHDAQADVQIPLVPIAEEKHYRQEGRGRQREGQVRRQGAHGMMPLEMF